MPLDPASLAAFLVPDGACRDINVAEAVPRAAALALLTFVAGRWNFASAADSEGETLADADALRHYLEHGSGATRSTWRGAGFIEQVQVLFAWTHADDVFFELTFFPEDVDRDTFDAAGFEDFLRGLMRASGAGEVHVRGENASWRHGATETFGDVYFTHRDL